MPEKRVNYSKIRNDAKLQWIHKPNDPSERAIKLALEEEDISRINARDV